MKPGDIVLVPFPHAELSQDKYRPALVIAVTPDKHRDFLLMQITSQRSQLIEGLFIELEAASPSFNETGLKITSFIRITRLATVSQGAIAGHLGYISDETLHLVIRRLLAWVERSNPG